MNYNHNKAMKNLDGDSQDQNWLNYINSLCSENHPPFDQVLQTFHKIYNNRNKEDGPPKVWTPKEHEIQNSNIAVLIRQLGFKNYDEFYKWSEENRVEFWEKTTKVLEYSFTKPFDKIIDLSENNMNPVWFFGAKLNCADSCFLAESDNIAIISGNENTLSLKKTTYRELEILVNRIANGIIHHGFVTGSRIAIYMPMTTLCVATYLGIIRAGCQVVSIADSFSASELKKRMRIADSKVIITMNSYKRSGKTIDLFSKVKEANIDTAIVIESESKNSVILRNDDIRWNDFISNKETYTSVQRDPDSFTNILFSSGTTGEPKAIPWNHLTPLKCASDGFYHQDIHKGDVVAWHTNIGWMMGPWLIFATLINKGTIALFEGSPTSKEFVNFLRKTEVKILGLIPSLVKAWRNSDLISIKDLKSVRLFSSTGEPSNWEDYFWLMSMTNFKSPIIEYMGGTEIGGGYLTGTVVQPASPSTFTTPALGCKIVLLNEERIEINEGEKGEVFLFSPSIGFSQKLLNKNHFNIYFKNCPSDSSGDLLRRHGDQVKLLHGGFYQAEGRIDDTMNIGGIKISSIEIEKIINTHEAVLENAAISVKEKGEAIENLVVFAVVNNSTLKVNLLSELKNLIAEKLNPLFKIQDLIVVKSLPKTASNKLIRRELRKRYMDSR